MNGPQTSKNIQKKVKCFICEAELYASKSKINRNKHYFCRRAHYYEYLASDDNPSKGKKRLLSDSARKRMRKSALKNLQTVKARKKSALSRTGVSLSESHKDNIKANCKRGWKNHSWKGRYASYAAKHIWADKYMSRPKICIDCGEDEINKNIQASNVDHQYYKNLSDWAWRCVDCHKRFDKEHGLINPSGKIKRMYKKYGDFQKRSITLDAIIVNHSI